MCGVLGLFSFTERTYQLQRVIADMSAPMINRGPDDCGVWLSPDSRLCFAHRRLSIVDLSSAGQQPMISACKRYILTLNGEIYNANELRKNISNYPFKGTSDTEVLLACISKWGINRALEKIIGMFAFSVWDAEEKKLVITRDRLGEKPLYFGVLSNGLKKDFIFSSDISSFELHPYFNEELNYDAIELYFRLNNIPAPYSIYKNIYKLKPGHLAQIYPYKSEAINTIQYWAIDNKAKENFLFKKENDEISQLDSLLNEVVGDHMTSDVPMGALLSGGIDSTLITAIMQKKTNYPVKTFTVAFNQEAHNESSYAKDIANFLGTSHTELSIEPQMVFDAIQKIPNIYGEPFSDASQIPQYLISKLASQTVKVVLSGDGGDEVFGGYRRYFMASKLWPLIEIFPLSLRNKVAQLLLTFSPDDWEKLSKLIPFLIPKSLGINSFGDKFHKVAFALTAEDSSALYERLIVGHDPDRCINLDTKLLQKLIRSVAIAKNLDQTSMMMLLDTELYMPNDVLVKVDRASMACSLESRAPFIDKRIVDFAWKLPINKKVNLGLGKVILRELLAKYVPEKLWDRPKMGFSLPISDWLRQDLRGWAEALLDQNLLSKYSFYNAKEIQSVWREHLEGKRNHQNALWNILMLQSWLLSKKK